jgi:hypothetical protein
MDIDINEFSARIGKRESEIQGQLTELDSKITSFTSWAWRFVWAGIFISLFAVVYFICKNNDLGFAINLLGDFMAGTVASIWSLAGLFFIYVAFLGQKQQLLNQQLEIMYSQLEVKYTRLELEGQKHEMIEQNQTLRHQRFENTFFQLVSLHHQIVNGIDLRKQGTVIDQGRDVFKSKYRFVKDDLRGVTSLDAINQRYLRHYKDSQTDFGHYFRNLYRIIKYIDSIDFLDFEGKYLYTSWLRAQLSSAELLMLFYNCISENGREMFKPLLERYHFLKNLPIEELGSAKHRSFYEESAFAKVMK